MICGFNSIEKVFSLINKLLEHVVELLNAIDLLRVTVLLSEIVGTYHDGDVFGIHLVCLYELRHFVVKLHMETECVKLLPVFICHFIDHAL